MANIIHMDTDQVLSVSQHLARAMANLQAQMQQIHGQVLNLDWYGNSRDIFAYEIGQIEQVTRRLTEEGCVLSQRVKTEIEEWIAIDQSFGRPTLGNMQDLARLVMTDETFNQPCSVVQIGENEYLVVLKGTRMEGGNVGNNWMAALTSGMGMPGDYERQVKEYLEKYLPAGANVHFTGHSQGGIVANNLADNQDFLDKYHVASVTTFGSPISAHQNKDTVYQRYAAVGDLVPMLAPLAPLYLLSGAKDQTFFFPKNNGLIVEPHVNYYKEDILKYDSLPFKVKEWNTTWNQNKDVNGNDVPESFTPQAKNGLSRVESNLLSKDPAKTVTGLLEVVQETKKTLKLGAVKTIVGGVSELLPEDTRQAVDRYMDRYTDTTLNEETPGFWGKVNHAAWDAISAI